MRFIENGPNIPDELLFAQDEGNVVFFCGAGVSMARANLFSFADLAQKVMEDLGVTEGSKAKEQFGAFNTLNKNVHTRGLISADHIFSSLRRNFHPNDINCSVAKILKLNNKPNLSAHKSILKLAQLRGGHTRLVTTNFDLLFEACNKNLKSVTRSNLPRIEYSDNDWGVVHLHGKVNSDYSAPAHDGFVLSSSEFGDAYLAQGWARNFVKSVLNKFVAVFIGYSADDPPIKYLLEGLHQGNSFNHKIYAFQSGPNDEAVAQWDEKGVEAIIYNQDENKTHSLLWDTLDAWGERSKNPTAWKRKVFSKGLKGPTKLKPHERGMIAHLIKSHSGARAFSETEPPMSSEWLCVFDPAIRLKQLKREHHLYSKEDLISPYLLYSLDDDPPPPGRNEQYEQIPTEAWNAFLLNERDYESLEEKHLPKIRGYRANTIAFLPDRLGYLAHWIGRVSDQRITAWWAGQQGCLHPDILRRVKNAITHNPGRFFPDQIVKAWSVIFELSYYSNRDEYEEYQLKEDIASMGWNGFTLREYAKTSAPFLKEGSLSSHLVPRDNRKKISNNALVRAEIDYPRGVFDLEIPDQYLIPVLSSLRINLEKAIDMEQEFAGWINLCSIEVDGELEGQSFERNYGLSSYVLYFVKLFKRLVSTNVEAARNEFIKWRNVDPVFIRLRVWASGLQNITTEEDFSNEILSLKQNDFWNSKGKRDLLLSLKNRWKDLSPKNRIKIERKILQGPEKYKTMSQEEYKASSDFDVLGVFLWLKNQGCEFSFDSDEFIKNLLKKMPEWKPEYSEKVVKSFDSHGGAVKTDTDWSNLKNISLSKIIEVVKKSKVRDYERLVEYAPFSGLCDDAPLKALGALSSQLGNDDFPTNFWKTYLSRDSRKKDRYRLKLLTGGRLIQIQDEDFSKILLEASRWFKGAGPELREKNINIFDLIWNKFIDTITKHEKVSFSGLVRQEEKEIDWVGEAINSAPGALAELHMTDTIKDNLNLAERYPNSWLSKVNQLLNLPNDSHRYTMVIFAYNLSWFYSIDPVWTEERLLKIIQDNNADMNDKDAIWAGFMWGARIPNSQLYVKLRPHFLEMAKERGSKRKRHIEVLSALLLSGWGSNDDNNQRFISDEELHSVILEADDNFRSHILWHLSRWSKSNENDWNNNIVKFLQNVWPKHKKVRTSKTSARLCEIAFTQKDNFPVISKQVAQLVSKIGNEHVHIPAIRKAGNNEQEVGDNLVFDYPEDYLNLLYAILPDQPERWPYGASNVLKHLEKADPKLLNDPRLIELKSRLNDL